MNKPSVGDTLRQLGVIGLFSTLVSGGYIGCTRGCTYIEQKLEEQGRDPDNPHAYNYRGFIGQEYVTFHTFLRPEVQLWIERSDGNDTLYICLGRRGLNLSEVHFYKNGLLEKKVTVESPEEKLELMTHHQYNFNKYLREIYRIKYSK